MASPRAGVEPYGAVRYWLTSRDSTGYVKRSHNFIFCDDVATPPEFTGKVDHKTGRIDLDWSKLAYSARDTKSYELEEIDVVEEEHTNDEGDWHVPIPLFAKSSSKHSITKRIPFDISKQTHISIDEESFIKGKYEKCGTEGEKC